MKLYFVLCICWLLFTVLKMSFNAEEFVCSFNDSANSDEISNLKKVDLVAVGKHLKLKVSSVMKKADIKKCVLQHYVLTGLLSETVLQEFEQKPSTDIEIRKLELEYQVKMKEMEIKGQLKLKELELEGKRMNVKEKTGSCEIGTFIKLVPRFNESDIDKYFLHFEKVAESCKWSKDIWAILLQSVLVGKAQEVYASLDMEQSSNYDVVKETILKAYELVPEAYRQKFRHCKKSENQTFVEFSREKEILFNRWCSSLNVTTLNDLKQLVMLEEFKRSIPLEIRTHLEEQHVSTLSQAAIMADDYALTHPKRLTKKMSSTTADVHDSSPDCRKSSQDSTLKSPQKDVKTSKLCHYCKMPGHVIAECRKLERKNQAKGEALTTTGSLAGVVPEGFRTFITDGYVALSSDHDRVPVKILRDTGGMQSLLLCGVLPLKRLPQQDTVLVHGVGGYKSIPLHEIHLESEFVTGQVTVGVIQNLPVQGVSLILGNDLAGKKVFAANPIMTPKVSVASDSDKQGQPVKEASSKCGSKRKTSDPLPAESGRKTGGTKTVAKEPIVSPPKSRSRKIAVPAKEEASVSIESGRKKLSSKIEAKEPVASPSKSRSRKRLAEAETVAKEVDAPLPRSRWGKRAATPEEVVKEQSVSPPKSRGRRNAVPAPETVADEPVASPPKSRGRKRTASPEDSVKETIISPTKPRSRKQAEASQRVADKPDEPAEPAKNQTSPSNKIRQSNLLNSHSAAELINLIDLLLHCFLNRTLCGNMTEGCVGLQCLFA